MKYYFPREMLKSCELDLCMDSDSWKDGFSSLSSCSVLGSSQSVCNPYGMQSSSAVHITNAMIMAVYKTLGLSMHCIACSTQRTFFVDAQYDDCVFLHIYFQSWCYLSSCCADDAGQIYAAIACEHGSVIKCLTEQQHDRLCSEIRCHKVFCTELPDQQSGFRYTPWLAWRVHARVSITGYVNLNAIQVVLPLGYADSRLLPVRNNACHENVLHTPYHMFLSMRVRSCVVLKKKIYLLANAKTKQCDHKVNPVRPVITLSKQSLKVDDLLDVPTSMHLASAFECLCAQAYRGVSSSRLNISNSPLGCVVTRPVVYTMRFSGFLQRLGIALQTYCGPCIRRLRRLSVCVLLCMSCQALSKTIFMITCVVLFLKMTACAWLSFFACCLIASCIRNKFYGMNKTLRVCPCNNQKPVFFLPALVQSAKNIVVISNSIRGCIGCSIKQDLRGKN